MPVKHEMILGPFQETSCTAITLNPESNFTRREKNHSLLHWNILTSPELRRQTWMLCKKAASMISGTSMDQEICLVLGQVSISLLYLVINLQKDIYIWSRARLTKRQATSRPDHLWREIIQKARRNLETPMAPAMPCKTCKKSKKGEGKPVARQSKFACILEARESTRMRVEETLPKNHEDHIAGKGDNSLQHYNLIHIFIPMPQAMKIPVAKKQPVDK